VYVVTFDPKNGQILFYIDGVLEHTFTGATVSEIDLNGGLVIGGNPMAGQDLIYDYH